MSTKIENSKPLFSICIPNYNYASYMDTTLTSLQAQTVQNVEVNVVDNASTDGSVEVIQKHLSNGLPIQFLVNPTNIGFAGNLDKVGRLAKAPWMIMLSSDDVVNKNAIEVYSKFIGEVGDQMNYAFCSTFEKIDGSGNFIEYLSPLTSSIWQKSDINQELTKKMGFDVYQVSSGKMLKRCLTKFLNPFNFASTCYPKELYEKIGGYGGGRLYNPDKWFHWKLLVELDFVYYLDSPLFQYRWHNNNQANQQQQNQILKYWIDEYRNCFEVTNEMLDKSGLTAGSISQHFADRCILPYVYKNLKEGNRVLAKRILLFGLSCYPTHVKRNKYYYPLLILCRIPFSKILLDKF